MKKRLLILVVCIATATMAACGNKETNGKVASTPTANDVQSTTASSRAESTTVSGETPEATEIPVTELTWENSGLELKIDEFENGPTIVTLTNTSENTYITDTNAGYIIKPGETLYLHLLGTTVERLSSIEGYSIIDNNNTSNYLQPQLVEATTKNITENGTELTYLYKDIMKAVNSPNVVILFDSDNNIVGIIRSDKVYVNESKLEGKVIIPNDFNADWVEAKLSVEKWLE